MYVSYIISSTLNSIWRYNWTYSKYSLNKKINYNIPQEQEPLKERATTGYTWVTSKYKFMQNTFRIWKWCIYWKYPCPYTYYMYSHTGSARGFVFQWYISYMLLRHLRWFLYSLVPPSPTVFLQNQWGHSVKELYPYLNLTTILSSSSPKPSSEENIMCVVLSCTPQLCK